jgi:putative endopeptidase
MKKTPLCLILTPLLLAALPVAADPESLAAPRFGTWGMDLTGRNLQIKPGDDFFDYANGSFVERTEIPADRVRFGNFDALSILCEARVRDILEEAVKTPTPATAKIAAFYTAYLDEAQADRLGMKPIAPDLAEINAAATATRFR